MEKITKKLFTELLCAHESALVASGFSKIDLDTSMEEKLSVLTQKKFEADGFVPDFRTVLRTTSAKIVFSNGSTLSFDDFGDKTYYKVGACIMQKNVIDNSKCDTCSDNSVDYGYVVYYLK